MARLDHARALGLLREVTGAATAAAADTDPRTAVPSCPGWTVTELVDHLGCVHLWAAHCARDAVQPDPYPARDPEAPLDRWYAGCADAIVDTLSALAPDHPSWSFSAVPGHQRADFWSRRQVHETSVHLVDLLQAAGRWPVVGRVEALPVLDAATAADGVAEVLEVMAPRALVRRRHEHPLDVVPAPAPVALHCTDTGDTWTVQLVDGAVRVADGDAGAVATIAGPAAHLYLSWWHRADPLHLDVTGDEEAGRLLLEASLVP